MPRRGRRRPTGQDSLLITSSHSTLSHTAYASDVSHTAYASDMDVASKRFHVLRSKVDRSTCSQVSFGRTKRMTVREYPSGVTSVNPAARNVAGAPM